MSDLISREKTLYRLATSAVYYFDLKEDKAAHDWAMHIVSGMPDEEPEIVRCRDCRHNQRKSTSGNALCELFYGMTDQMGYCHMAERRTNE